VLSRMSYTPYGLPTLPMDGVGYTGHFMDVGTQLTYMQQRYYDPQIGRFLSIDPVTVADGDNRHFNRYSYSYSNPYKFTDPDGRCPICVAVFAFVSLMSHSEPANAPDIGERPQRTSSGEAIQAVAGALPGGRLVTGLRSGLGAGNGLSQRAANREARRQAGVPTSQQASSQHNGRANDGTPVGRQQTYEVPKPGGGTQTISVQVSRDTQGKHAGMPQIEAGKTKPGGQTDEAGRPRLQNEGKVRVDFVP
jgi:RHS repeat-associated protein